MTVGRLSRATLVVVLVLGVLIPFAWVLRVALKPTDGYVSDPAGLGGGFTLSNFTDAWSSGGLGSAIANSLLVVPLGAVIATTLSTLAGYGLAKLPFPGAKIVRGVIVAGIAVPLAAIVIPEFDQGLAIGYVNSRPGLSLVYGTFFACWGTLFMESYMVGIPDELLESGQMDGANTVQSFVRLVLPLAAPAIITVLMLNVFLQWSELILALVMLPNNPTITVAIAQFSTQFYTGGPLTAAGMIIVAAPIFVLFLVGQRWIRRAVFAGAVKG